MDEALTHFNIRTFTAVAAIHDVTVTARNFTQTSTLFFKCWPSTLQVHVLSKSSIITIIIIIVIITEYKKNIYSCHRTLTEA